MKKSTVDFLGKLVIFSLVLGAITLSLATLLPKSYFSPALPFLFFFFIASTILSWHFLQQSFEKKFIRFVNTYLLTVIAKLLLYIVVLVAYVFINRHDAIAFMLGFFILYLCYTIFEVVFIIKNTSPPKN